ncbi:MAG TPA: preprotein translocase subunit SecE [Candidatus Hydrogenedentes bacterium]|nr:preprotein translocase subunit SecE [Candidatus Hydrogenedentota bacterium]HPC17245.1 preprotein translocase subunit SecE [Candidatus Hydrogenedentota bacterium]HRT19027.1 preprotein translocase subunit SecE [Candidatus Hydrogenedentota bacterium]HRT65616.1 preprotein translocase subunit SecE [Candidatus Hydrogenedentota bacterium]
MAKQIADAEVKKTIPVRIKEFYQDVMVEMGKVTWPSREELKTSTSVVLLLLVIVAAIIYVYDFVFQIMVFGLFKLV